MDHGGAHELIHWIAALVLVIGGAIFLALAAHQRFGPGRRRGEARGVRRDRPTDVPAGAVDRSLIVIVASLSLSAAAIHLAAAPHHYAELGDVGAGFLVAGVFQAAWARAALTATTRRTAWIGIIVNLGIVAAWIVSRTVGLPVGPAPWTAEAVGSADLVSTALELVIVVGCGVLLARKSIGPPLPEVTSVGRALMVPWQSMHSIVVAARGSP